MNGFLSISSSLYGYKIKSAYCKKAGIGEEYAEWIVKIKEPGKYRVVAHVPESLYATSGSFLKMQGCIIKYFRRKEILM